MVFGAIFGNVYVCVFIYIALLHCFFWDVWVTYVRFFGTHLVSQADFVNL